MLWLLLLLPLLPTLFARALARFAFAFVTHWTRLKRSAVAVAVAASTLSRWEAEEVEGREEGFGTELRGLRWCGGWGLLLLGRADRAAAAAAAAASYEIVEFREGSDLILPVRVGRKKRLWNSVKFRKIHQK